jgi:hypothetical protein
MSIDFKIVPHSFKPGVNIVEVWLGDKLVGAVYPDGDGIKIVSTISTASSLMMRGATRVHVRFLP